MKRLSFLFAVLFSVSAHADLEQEATQYCEKMKACTLSVMDNEAISGLEKAAILDVFGTPCVAAIRKNEVELANAGLENRAKACIGSLNDLTCGAIINGQGRLTTPMCTKLSNESQAAGITLGL